MAAPTTNHHVVFVEQGKAELLERELPKPTGNQLLIRTRVSLISPGTERAFFLGLPNTAQRYPQLSGYSNIGEVVATGEQVSGWPVGTRVASATPHAAYVLVDANRCIPVPSQLPDDEAVFFNLVSIALQGIRKARIEIGEPVVVLGAGLIGLLAVQLARLNGALPAISVDQEERRLDFAKKVNADACVLANDQLATTIARLAEPLGTAVVIEATGHPQVILTALDLARPGGRVVLLGSTRGETDHVNFYRDVHRKGITIIGAHNFARPQHESSPGWWAEIDDQRVALSLLALKRIIVHPLITHRFSWQQAPQAYELLKVWDLNALGMLLNWRP